MTKHNVLIYSLLFALSATAATAAVSYPYKEHKEQNIDDHQVGAIDLAIDSQGHGTLHHFWSNGKQIAGNNFYSVVALRAKDGRVIWSDKQVKGLDGSGGGHAREGEVTITFSLTKDQMDEFDHYDFKMGAQNCGIDLTSVRFTDNGIELGFGTCKVEEPKAPRP